MQLIQHLSETRGLAAVIARDAGLSRPYIWQCAAGRRTLPAVAGPAIERATGGQVTCEELRPDVRWQRVPDPDWPHPDGRPCIDVAAPATVVRGEQEAGPLGAAGKGEARDAV